MDESRRIVERRIADPFLDRRSGDDRRRAYDLDYFAEGGPERRKSAERRDGDERRDQCVRVAEWSSICHEKP